MLFSILPLCASSQKCVVANTKQNVIYLGVPNPIDVAVEGYKCKDLTVTTDNGKLEGTDDKCSYDHYPEKAGRANIIVTEKKSGNKLGIVEFRVKYIPEPVAMVAGKQGGAISKNVLRAQVGITSVLLGFDFDARFVVERFTISIIRKGKSFYVEECTNPKFTDSTKNAFDKLADGDKIIFTDIVCRGPDSRSRRLQPIEFIVSE